MVEALGWQSTPCFSSFSKVSASTCSISTVSIPHLCRKAKLGWEMLNKIGSKMLSFTS